MSTTACVVLTDAQRLDVLIPVAQESDLTLDLLERLSRNMDAMSFAIFTDNVSMLAQYMKSNDMPYVSRSRSAPDSESLWVPNSHCE